MSYSVDYWIKKNGKTQVLSAKKFIEPDNLTDWIGIEKFTNLEQIQRSYKSHINTESHEFLVKGNLPKTVKILEITGEQDNLNFDLPFRLQFGKTRNRFWQTLTRNIWSI